MKSKAARVGSRRQESPKTRPRPESDQSVEFCFNLRDDGIAAGFLFALTVFYFLPVLAAGGSRILSAEGADVWNQYFYWRHFGFNALALGELPLWNPYIFSGAPYIAGIQSAIFYPLNVIYLLFDTAFATNLSVALHCFLASFFTYVYARYLGLMPVAASLSGVTFAYGAPYFLHIFAGHLSNLSTMAWLPLLFLSIEAFLRKGRMIYPLLGGLVLAIQVFAGHPQYLFYSGIAVGCYFALNLIIARERHRLAFLLGGFGLFMASGIALSAVQLFPAVELTRHSVREALTYEWVSMFSLPPEKLSTLLLRDFFGDALTVPYWGKNYLWEMSLYLGLVSLVAAATAMIIDRSRAVKIFSALAVLSLLLAFGKYTPLLKILYTFVPGFDLFRGLSKFVFVFAFAAAMLAGYGLRKIDDLAKSDVRKLIRLSIAVGGLALVLLAMAGAFYLVGANGLRTLIASVQQSEDIFSVAPAPAGKFLTDAFENILLNTLGAAVILLGLAGVLFAGPKLKNLSQPLVSVLVVGLAVADLWLFGFRYLVTFDPARLSRDHELQSVLKQEKEPFRVASPMFSMVNVGLLDGIENVGGYDAIVLKRYSDFIGVSQGLSADQPNIVMTSERFSPMLRLLNVKYYLLEAGMKFPTPALVPVFENHRYKVYRDDRALPRSYIVHDVRFVRSEKEALQTLADPAFRPEVSAVVEEMLHNLPNDPERRSPKPAIVSRSLNSISLEAEPTAPGLLVLSDAYYPGWKAFVAGKESKVYRTNSVIRGVLVPQGRHRIEFRYDPASFKVGAATSLITLVLLLGYLLWTIRAQVRGRSGAKLVASH
jgi:hypothetical protein